jgi:hypothetical protein
VFACLQALLILGNFPDVKSASIIVSHMYVFIKILQGAYFFMQQVCFKGFPVLLKRYFIFTLIFSNQ